MALRVPQSATPQLFKEGYKTLQGLEEAVIRNIHAAKEMSEITRTSYGPNGRNKMVINHLEKLFVTNDAATIIQELDVVHPAAKLLVMASQQQEDEAGDGTNYVIILASELLQKAEDLLRMGLHPSEISVGYELAMKKALKYLETDIHSVKVDLTNEEDLFRAARTAIASKQYGYEDFLGKLVVEAVKAAMPKNPEHFNVDNVRVVKILGGSLLQSRVVHGMVFPREPETFLKEAKHAKVAVFTCPVDIGQTETKGTVLLHNAKEMLEYTKGEEEQLEKAVLELVDAGINVVVGGSGIGDLAVHYLNRHNIVAINCPSKFELRRLCRVIGANPLARFGAPTAEETGYCDLVHTEEIGSDRVTVFRQYSTREAEEKGNNRPAFASRVHKSPVVTLVLRGATQNMLDDVERAVDDGVNVTKALTKDQRLVPGAAATEIELNRHVTREANLTPGISQHAMRRYAEAFEVFPRTLADNAGVNSTEMLAKLFAAHSSTDKSAFENPQAMGIDVDSDRAELKDVTKANIYDSLAVKQWAVRYATQAALTVLQVDQIIMAKRAGGPKLPQQSGNWDDQD
ncbi:T-complex protein 1 subunit theta [Spiromyces aspiralis]|uniref:T-complex protein 1 subunit theta n=1 Tax=Spiromyces aspiralis TaxID=68401 RepID=A0ACC1HU05_9FUNG|nr:T-complex protein 1 subunit theta [Spiromyces aspiralis]